MDGNVWLVWRHDALVGVCASEQVADRYRESAVDCELAHARVLVDRGWLAPEHARRDLIARAYSVERRAVEAETRVPAEELAA